jgi:hypothetical protein
MDPNNVSFDARVMMTNALNRMVTKSGVQFSHAEAHAAHNAI